MRPDIADNDISVMSFRYNNLGTCQFSCTPRYYFQFLLLKWKEENESGTSVTSFQPHSIDARRNSEKESSQAAFPDTVGASSRRDYDRSQLDR